MGIVGIRLSETKDYFSEYDKIEPKTKWILGPVDAEVFSSLGEGSRNILRTAFDAVRFGLKGFENFKDEHGNIVKFSTSSVVFGSRNCKVISDDIMKIMPPEIITELGLEIMKLSRLSEEEIKN